MCDTDRRLALLGALTIVLGCATNTAPSHFLPSPADAQTQAFGGWIELRFASTGRDSAVDGELLAATSDSVWVLTGTGWVVTPTATVRQGKLTAYDSRWGAVAGYTLMGVLSTISNGWYLVLTAPVWVITGTVAGANQSHAPERKTPPLRWSELSAFARFPQGMPPDIRLGDLRPKLSPSPETKP
jgi:hypothetical protein